MAHQYLNSYYEIHNSYILHNYSSIFSFVPLADVTVKGIVVNAETNHPLVGVAVSVEGKTAGVVSDQQGKFEITVPAGCRLLFSAIGFNDQFILINKRWDSLKVLMQPGLSAGLDEVIVTGYGSKPDRRTRGLAGKRKTSSPISSVYNHYGKEQDYNTEEYSSIEENRFRDVRNVPLSHFLLMWMRHHTVICADFYNRDNYLPPAPFGSKR